MVGITRLDARLNGAIQNNNNNENADKNSSFDELSHVFSTINYLVVILFLLQSILFVSSLVTCYLLVVVVVVQIDFSIIVLFLLREE